MEWKCSYCGEKMQCSCPDDKLHTLEGTKSACPVCLELMEMGIKEDELKTSPKREEARKRAALFTTASAIGTALTENEFEKMWAGEKQELREMSKNELAAECFYRGAVAISIFFLQAHADGKLSDYLEAARKAYDQTPKTFLHVN